MYAGRHRIDVSSSSNNLTERLYLGSATSKWHPAPLIQTEVLAIFDSANAVTRKKALVNNNPVVTCVSGLSPNASHKRAIPSLVLARPVAHCVLPQP